MTMTKKLALAAIALTAVLLVACTATIHAPPEPKSVRKVSVVIAAEPGDAEVYLDGKFVGTTTMEVRLSPGTYKIEVRRTGYKPWVRDLAVADYSTRMTALLERE